MATMETAIPNPGNPILNNPEEVAATSNLPASEATSQTKSIQAVSASAAPHDVEGKDGGTEETTKSSKRSTFFGFGKKKEDDKLKKKKGANEVSEKTVTAMANSQEIPVATQSKRRTPPPIKNHPYGLPASPHRNVFSSSPRLVSPAGSQIFERDVMESAPSLPIPSAIPSHIQTEDHIPAVLDASSEAITNENIDPDSVEIVMHAAHQPAAVAVTGVVSPEPSGIWGEESINHIEEEQPATNYGALDSADVRRLSFISFQDIVQSEHAEHASNRDSLYVAGLSSLSSTHNRSPSPIRSPLSSPGLDSSVPTSQTASVVGLSPKIRPFGSPIQASHPTGSTTGELTIETMTQALRRTGSGDLSGARSQPLSPTSPKEGSSDGTFR